MKRSAELTAAQSAKPRKKKKWTREDVELSLLGFPTFIWYVLFSYLPMFGIMIAFKQYKVFPRQSFLYNLLHSEFAYILGIEPNAVPQFIAAELGDE